MPIQNNYVTEGVPTSNLEVSITASNNISSVSNTSTSQSNTNINSSEEFNPMSGIGDISNFG